MTESESTLLTKLRKHLHAWPLYPPKDERDYSAGSVLFVHRNDTFTPTLQRIIDYVKRTNEDPIHLGECQGFDAAVELSAAVPVDGAGGQVDAKASGQSSVNMSLYDRICERIPLPEPEMLLFRGVDTLFYKRCKMDAFSLLERTSHTEITQTARAFPVVSKAQKDEQESRVYAVVTRAHVAGVTSEMVSSQAFSALVKVFAPTAKVAVKAGFS